MAPFSAHVNGNVIKCSTRNRIAPNATDAPDTAGESFLRLPVSWKREKVSSSLEHTACNTRDVLQLWK